MTEDEIKLSLSDEIKELTKVMLVDAAMAGHDIYIMSFRETVMLYIKKAPYTEKIIFRWRRSGKPPHLPIRTDRPLAMQEALALVDDNWDRRTFTETATSAYSK